MMRFQKAVLSTITAAAALTTATAVAQTSAKPSAAKQGLEKLKALEGEWIDVDGDFVKFDNLPEADTYRHRVHAR